LAYFLLIKPINISVFLNRMETKDLDRIVGQTPATMYDRFRAAGGYIRPGCLAQSACLGSLGAVIYGASTFTLEDPWKGLALVLGGILTCKILDRYHEI